jgi:uncharacterized membrane protein
MKMQIQLKYGLAEKSASIGVSAGRNVFPAGSADKNLSINLISNFFGKFVLVCHGGE